MQDDPTFLPKARIDTPMQFTAYGANFKHKPPQLTQDESKFTMRDLGIAVMQAQDECIGRVYAAHKQLNENLEALHARAIAAGLINEGDPLPSTYLLSSPE